MSVGYVKNCNSLEDLIDSIHYENSKGKTMDKEIEYKDAIESIADEIVNDHCDLIEMEEDENGRPTPDLFNILNLVASSVNDLEYDRQTKIMMLNPVFEEQEKEKRNTMVAPDLLEKLFNGTLDSFSRDEIKCCFVDQHEDILKDCIEDVKNEVEKYSRKHFYDNLKTDTIND